MSTYSARYDSTAYSSPYQGASPSSILGAPRVATSHSRASLDRPEYLSPQSSPATSAAYSRHLSPPSVPTHTALTYYSPAPEWQQRQQRQEQLQHHHHHAYATSANSDRRLSPTRDASPVALRYQQPFISPYSAPPPVSRSEASTETPRTPPPQPPPQQAEAPQPAQPPPAAPPSIPLAQHEALQREADQLRSQLAQAVAAHTALMGEYQRKSDEHKNAQREMEEMAAECNELHAALDKAQSQNTQSAASRDRVESELRHQIELMTQERDVMLERMQALTKSAMEHRAQDGAGSASKDGEITVLRQRVQLLEEKHNEAVKTALRLTEELEAERKSSVQLRAKHSADIQQVLREALASNENAVASVSAELVRSHEASVRLLEQDRLQLREQAADAARQLAAAREAHNAAMLREMAQADELRRAVETLTKQRDDLLSEAKFQMEIVSDHQQEKASMRAEIATLRAVVASLGSAAAATHRANPAALPSRVSTANVSHALSGSLVDDDNQSALSPTNLKAPSREEAYAAEHSKRETVQLQQQVRELTELLDRAVADAREKEHTIVMLTAELASARAAASANAAYEGESFNDKLSEMQKRIDDDDATIQKLRADLAAASAASTTTSGGPSDLEAKLARTEEELEDANSVLAGLNFEIAELRKQLQGAREKLRLRDADLEEQQRNYAALEAKLQTEREYGDKARADVEEIERRLAEQTREMSTRIESLSRELDDATKKHTILVEQADAAEIAMADMEQTLADALFALQQQQQSFGGIEAVESRVASSYALPVLRGEGKEDQQAEAPRAPTPSSPKELNATGTIPPESAQVAAAAASASPPASERLDEKEAQQLLAEVASDPNAVRLIGAMQRRRLNSRKGSVPPQ